MDWSLLDEVVRKLRKERKEYVNDVISDGTEEGNKLALHCACLEAILKENWIKDELVAFMYINNSKSYALRAGGKGYVRMYRVVICKRDKFVTRMDLNDVLKNLKMGKEVMKNGFIIGKDWIPNEKDYVKGDTIFGFNEEITELIYGGVKIEIEEFRKRCTFII